MDPDDAVVLEERVVRRRVGDAVDEPDHEQSAIPVHATANLVEGVATHRVIGDVDTAPGCLTDRVDPLGCRTVIDHDVAAEPAQEIGFLGTARYCTDPRPRSLAELDRGGAGSARCASDQEPFARSQFGPGRVARTRWFRS